METKLIATKVHVCHIMGTFNFTYNFDSWIHYPTNSYIPLMLNPTRSFFESCNAPFVALTLACDVAALESGILGKDYKPPPWQDV